VISKVTNKTLEHAIAVAAHLPEDEQETIA
jgi:hypothetical protein